MNEIRIYGIWLNMIFLIDHIIKIW
jgi:hypothetical protein